VAGIPFVMVASTGVFCGGGLTLGIGGWQFGSGLIEVQILGEIFHLFDGIL
jgi:hypothetical protein